MDQEYPTIHFPRRPVDGPYIEVEHPANHVRDLVEELGEDWPVFDESRGGVGVDP